MFEELLARIARNLNEANIPYMVIGGQAVLLYGEPKSYVEHWLTEFDHTFPGKNFLDTFKRISELI